MVVSLMDQVLKYIAQIFQHVETKRSVLNCVLSLRFAKSILVSFCPLIVNTARNCLMCSIGSMCIGFFYLLLCN